MGLRKGVETKDADGPAFELEWDKFRGKHRDHVTATRRVHLASTSTGLMWKTEKSAKECHKELVAAVSLWSRHPGRASGPLRDD